MNVRNEWLEARRKGIGGSDVAAILGLSRYGSQYTVWADKLGKLESKPDSEAMRIGRDMEGYVAKRFSEATGHAIRRDNRTFLNPLYPHSIAHIDRRIVGRKAGLECKCVSPFRVKEFEGGAIPPEYLAQCLHYIAVTGWDAWYLAVLIFQAELKIYEIRRSEWPDDIARIQAEAQSFWEQYVIPGIPPPTDGHEATTAAINEVYRTAVEGAIDLSGMEDTFIALAQLGDAQKALDTEKERHRQAIKLAMGESTRAECSAWVANWRPNKNGTRVFTIKEKG